MSNLLRKCPFDVELTSLSLINDCLQEVLPFKDLSEIVAFHNFLNNGKKLPWIDQVAEIQPATDYCYLNTENEPDDEGWFPKPRIDRNSVPKTLFCHDYKGGYLEDRFINGSAEYESYNFFSWTLVDVFVYFSHSFVTVPPPVWINASHTHGVPILGTLITEGKNGHLVWEKILESEEKAIWFAEILALIAGSYKFDGYLLNIENAINVNLMPLLMIFIKSLKKFLHKYKKHKTYVIWYDSVTVYGELRWQNELNYSNKPFFDITDGIFLNYSWKEQNLDHSRKMAGERIHDVFIGIDVFGRNMFGGGGFNTKVALEMVQQKNLSSALFAFGWTKEKIPGNFYVNDYLFWINNFSYLHSHGTKQFPFKSDFNRGCGLKYYKEGNVVSDKPWFNLSKQSYQFSYLKCRTKANVQVDNEIVATIKEYLFVLNEKKSPEEEFAKTEKLVNLNAKINGLYRNLKSSVIEYTFDDAFHGGGCIRITPSFEEGIRHIPLFDTDIEVNQDWFVKTVMKSENEEHVSDVEIYPIVYLVVQTKEGVLTKLELRHGEIESSLAGWAIRKFMLSQKGRIIEIGLLINPTHRPVLFGEIAVSDRERYERDGDNSRRPAPKRNPEKESGRGKFPGKAEVKDRKKVDRREEEKAKKRKNERILEEAKRKKEK